MCHADALGSRSHAKSTKESAFLLHFCMIRICFDV